MTAVINYDRPMKNLIDELSATGHVTHTAYRKTMVTIHHNGGRLSHEGCLNVWKTRPASAHFDIDASGAACQYVKVNEYAWACASQTGNQTSISIEMADATLSPTWEVSETTWKSAARLAGWLFARVIGARPTAATLVYHSHWYSTACAGPYMAGIYARVLAETQAAYDAFTTNTAPQEDDMPYTPDQLQDFVKVALIEAATRATPVDRQASDALRAIIRGELAAAVDETKLAAALAPAVVALLPATSAVTVDTLAAALKDVLRTGTGTAA